MINQCIELQKKYKELNEKGLIGIDRKYIHLNLVAFKKLFKDYNLETKWNNESVELKVVVNGVEFLTLV